MKNLFEIELKKSKNASYQQNNKQNKKVLVATPTLDGKVDIWYVDSLSKTIKICKDQNIDVIPLYISNESIIHMARNEFIKFAYEGRFDSIVFIDGDQSWDPDYFLKVVQSEKDALALPVCLKKDNPIFNLSTYSDMKDVKIDKHTGEFTVEKIGTGFFKLSKKLVEDLWNSNETIQFRDISLKFIFDFSLDGSKYVGEDYTLCKKIRELGYDVWVNPNSTCSHIGQKKYTHDFMKFVSSKK